MSDAATTILTTALPYIGTALLGPLGGGIASLIASKLGVPAQTIQDTKDTLVSMLGDPAKLAELKQVEAAAQAHLAELGYDNIQKLEEINASVVIEVNKTMQSETTSNHWPSYSWRPFIGFTFGFYITAQWLLPMLHIPAPVIDAQLMLAIGGILGVASWFRGKGQSNNSTDQRG